jgi:hypothetical protein
MLQRYPARLATADKTRLVRRIRFSGVERLTCKSVEYFNRNFGDTRKEVVSRCAGEDPRVEVFNGLCSKAQQPIACAAQRFGASY